MSDFRSPAGFEDAMRPPIDIRRARLTPAVLRPSGSGPGDTARARLDRIARRVPEVMVKITGRTRDGGHLLRHLDYISRNGRLPLEGPDGERHAGREAIQGLAADWTMDAATARGGRSDSPVSRSIILSMPAGVEPHRVEDAARAFARSVFGDRFDYVFALHDEGRHPHVHLSVCALGRDGDRLNPRKADLQAWREAFARELRARGLEAEATPRRARGMVLKAERLPVRKLRERFVDGRGPLPGTLETAYRDAGGAQNAGEPWRPRVRERQRSVRRAYVVWSLTLSRSGHEQDRALGAALEAFVRSMPAIETRADKVRRLSTDLSKSRVRDGPDGSQGPTRRR